MLKYQYTVSVSGDIFCVRRFFLCSISRHCATIPLAQWILRYLASQQAKVKRNPSAACASAVPFGVGRLLGGIAGVNSTYVWLLGGLSYLVACFERCIAFISKNAYIQVKRL
eukprot:GHVT01042343.1.p2 GENE.GHVT01042343.1~~GHVT01042343.1.p2  ORF type:complete len:112 (-),score=5.07 GHVT01042343.1:449-784(-)